jgi:membrane-associated phospholipid phosphatase
MKKTTQNIIGLSACLSLALGLGLICREVWEKETSSLDGAFLLGLHHWANPGLDTVMVSITRLGDPAFVVVIVAIALTWLLYQRKRLESVMLVVACLGAVGLNSGLKLVFGRTRPHLWTSLIHETTYGFPSGHALGSLVLYGFIAYLYARRYPRRAKVTYGITAIVVALIGLSRLYLGVHYPTDVLAGYGMGMLWLVACLLFMGWRGRLAPVRQVFDL